MASKAEVEKELKELKQKFRELAQEKKSFAAEEKDLTNLGYGVILDEESNKFSLVALKFNVEKKSAIIGEVKEISKSAMEASTYAKRAVVDEIVKLNKGR